MAVRVRKNGRIFCAAMNPEKEGDIYIDDRLHYYLSVEVGVLVTQEAEQHLKSNGEWWWINKLPNDKLKWKKNEVIKLLYKHDPLVYLKEVSKNGLHYTTLLTLLNKIEVHFYIPLDCLGDAVFEPEMYSKYLISLDTCLVVEHKINYL